MYMCKTPGSITSIINGGKYEKPTGSSDWNTGLAINESESVSMEKECAHELNRATSMIFSRPMTLINHRSTNSFIDQSTIDQQALSIDRHRPLT